MKITNITTNKIQNNTISNTNFQKNYQNNTQDKINYTKAPNNPKYYQISNNISFCSSSYFIAKPTKTGITIQIPMDSKDKITLNFSLDEAKIFLNDNGTIDNKIVERYIEIFKEFYAARKEIYEQQKEMLERTIKESNRNKIISLNTKEDLDNAHKIASNDEERYMECYLSNINDDCERKKAAETFLSSLEEKMAKSTHTIAKEALYLITISKLSDDKDDKANEKKAQIASAIAGYEEINFGKYFDDLIQNSTDENGNFDLDLCYKISKLLLLSYYSPEAEYEIENLSSIVNFLKEKDPKNYEESYNAILYLSEQGIINLSYGNDNLSTFLNCYNPKTNSFDNKAPRILLEFFDKGSQWIYKNIDDLNEDNIDYYAQELQVMANEYFSLIRNQKTGEIIKDYLSVDEFFEAYA